MTQQVNIVFSSSNVKMGLSVNMIKFHANHILQNTIKFTQFLVL